MSYTPRTISFKEQREMAKSAAERKKAEREAMRAAGYVLRQVWVHDNDWPRVSKYLQRVTDRRKPGSKPDAQVKRARVKPAKP